MTITAARQAKTAAPLFAGQSTDHGPLVSDDFVDDVIAIFFALGIKPDLCSQAAASVRERWGGDRPYIARRAGEGRSDRNANIRRDHVHGATVAVLQRRYQLGRRQILRVLRLPDDTA